MLLGVLYLGFVPCHVAHAACYRDPYFLTPPPAKTPCSASSPDFTALAHGFAFVTSWKPCHCEISSFNSFVTSWCCLTMLLPANSPDTTSILHSTCTQQQAAQACQCQCVGLCRRPGSSAALLAQRTHPPVHGATAPTRVCYFDSLAVEPLRNLLCYLSLCGSSGEAGLRGGVWRIGRRWGTPKQQWRRVTQVVVVAPMSLSASIAVANHFLAAEQLSNALLLDAPACLNMRSLTAGCGGGDLLLCWPGGSNQRDCG